MYNYDKGYEFKDIKNRIPDALQKEKDAYMPTDKLLQLAIEVKVSTAKDLSGKGLSETALLDRIYSAMRADATIELAIESKKIAEANMKLIEEAKTSSKYAMWTAKGTWFLAVGTIILCLIKYI